MKYGKIRCRNCGNYFYPDNYNYRHQKYCPRDECRKASRRGSSKKYRSKKSGSADFRRDESARVQKWQSKNPSYWKNRKKNSKKFSEKDVLRDFAQVENLQSEMVVLRDFANSQYLVMKGLISTLTDDVLRDNIGGYLRRMYDKGREVSGAVPEKDFIMQLEKMRYRNEEQNIN